MIIRAMRCYFFYDVPATERLISDNDRFSVGVTPQVVARLKQHFQVRPAEPPAFYTAHYRHEHTPYLVSDPCLSHTTCIPKEKLLAIPFFADLGLTQDIDVHWELMLTLQSTGLITLCLEVKEPLPSGLAYRLSGLYLNPAYAVIATGPVSQLWETAPGTAAPESLTTKDTKNTNAEALEATPRAAQENLTTQGTQGREEQAPEFVSPDVLARALHAYFFKACGLKVQRHRALRHEIQIPLTAIEVETDCANQREFMQKEAMALAELVFKPACWEVEHTSAYHVGQILTNDRIWSVARDTLVIVAYEGSLYVKLKPFDTGVAHEVSGFRLADEPSILHTIKVAVGTYHFLRELDDLLDTEMHQLVTAIHRRQHMLRQSQDNEPILQEMDQFLIEAVRLRFGLLDLLEEINNSDKLIDEEWHIVLLDRLNRVFNTNAWFDGLGRRVEGLRDLIHTVEDTYQKLTSLDVSRHIAQFNAQMLQMNVENQKVDDRLRKAQPFFEALAAVEALNLLVNIWFDPSYVMLVTLSQWLHWPVGLPIRLIGTVLVGSALILMIYLIRWISNWLPNIGDAA